MANYYGFFVTIHLLCALVFVGAVFFEVLVIEPIEKTLPAGVGAQIAEAIPRRVRVFMPVVVSLLYLTGAAMFWVGISPRARTFFKPSSACCSPPRLAVYFIRIHKYRVWIHLCSLERS